MKTFKEFNERYNPSPEIDKKREMKKASSLSTLDKMGRFIPFDKKFLEDCGFEIKTNQPTDEKYFSEKQNCGAKLSNAGEIAESSIDKYRIIIWKYSPKEEDYMFVTYHYYILDSRNNILFKGEKSNNNNYMKYSLEGIEKSRKESLIYILDEITVELESLGIKVPDIPNPRADIDPFNEEEWEEEKKEKKVPPTIVEDPYGEEAWGA